MIIQQKCLGTGDCKYMENILTILISKFCLNYLPSGTYQFEREMTLWSRLWCPWALAANLVANSCRTAYGVESIPLYTEWKLHPAVFKISVGPGTLTGKIWVGPASFTSLSYINFGRIVLQSSKFKIFFWKLIQQKKLITIFFNLKSFFERGSIYQILLQEVKSVMSALK